MLTTGTTMSDLISDLGTIPSPVYVFVMLKEKSSYDIDYHSKCHAKPGTEQRDKVHTLVLSQLKAKIGQPFQSAHTERSKVHTDQ